MTMLCWFFLTVHHPGACIKPGQGAAVLSAPRTATCDSRCEHAHQRARDQCSLVLATPPAVPPVLVYVGLCLFACEAHVHTCQGPEYTHAHHTKQAAGQLRKRGVVYFVKWRPRGMKAAICAKRRPWDKRGSRSALRLLSWHEVFLQTCQVLGLVVCQGRVALPVGVVLLQQVDVLLHGLLLGCACFGTSRHKQMQGVGLHG